MKKLFSTLLVAILALSIILPIFCYAQSESASPETKNEGTPPQRLEAVAGDDMNVPVGTKVLFDGSKSTNSKDGTLKFIWDFGDETIVEGVNELHIYEKPGTYKVTLTIDNGEDQDTDELIISVYEDLIILIADATPKEKDLDELYQFATSQGVLLITLQDKSGQPDYILVETLAELLADNIDDVKKSDIIIDWTSETVGLNALTKFIQKVGNPEELKFAKKGIVSITNKPSVISRIAQTTFDLVQPEYILLTSEAALHPVISARESENVIDQVKGSFINYKLIGTYSERTVKNLGFTNFMSYLINYMVNKGVPLNTIFLILMLPVIATIISFSRQVIGFKAFGIYIPSILTLAFLATGLKYGITIFVVLLVVATLARFILKKFRLLYLPRMAVVLTVLSLSILATFAIGAYTMRTGLIAISIFPILIITMLTERFVAVQIEKGFIAAIQVSVETIVISVICYFLVSWGALRTIILSYPELILLTLVINFALGKWTGLRLSEYLRFRKILKHTKNI